MFCINCGQEVSQNSKYCPNCGAEIKNRQINNNTSIKNLSVDENSGEVSAVKIKDYLSKIKILETMVFEQSSLLDNIHYELNSYRNWSPKASLSYRGYSFNFGTFISLVIGIGLIAWLPCMLIGGAINEDNGFGIGIIVAWCLGFAVAIIVEIDKANVDNGNKKRIIKENAIIERDNNEGRKLVDFACRQLEAESAKVEKKLIDTKAVLNKVYNIGILYPDYRNFVAVCSIYQYFDAERCYTLKGPAGAYNIFEQEKRLNLIIDRLDVIISALERIERNQRVLYNSIVSAQDAVAGVMNEIRGDIKRSNQINYERKEYARMAAINTETLVWMKAFEK